MTEKTIEVENTIIPSKEENVEESKATKDISETINEEQTEIIEEYPCTTVEDKLKIPYIEKANGNIMARKGDYEASMKHYSKALLGVKYLRDGGHIQTEELIRQYGTEIELPVNLNLALCNIKVKNYPYAIHHANQVLEYDPNNCKGLFRRGIGLHNTANVIYFCKTQYKEARADLEKALELEPNNEEIKAELKNLDNSVQKYKNKTKRMMKAMFWGEGGKAEEGEEEPKPEEKNTQKEDEPKEQKEEPEKSTIRKGIDAVKGMASGAYNAIFGKKQIIN